MPTGCYDAKEARDATSPQFHSSSPSADLTTFLAWCTAQGIQLDSRLEAVRNDQHGSISIIATEPIQAGDVVVRVPKSTAILSARTSALSPHLLASAPRKRGSHRAELDLALCLLFEQLLATASHFHPYLKILPSDGVPLPLLRREDAQQDEWTWIRGTEADRIGKRASECLLADSAEAWRHGIENGVCKATLTSYFHTFAVPLLTRCASDLLSHPTTTANLERAFLRAFTLVSSRSFLVDIYHGPALVPYCDLFDHSEAHTVHFEATETVCPRCGLTDRLRCTHLRASASVSPLDIRREDGVEYDTVDMRTLHPHTPGQQMYNTYGALSNAQLLTRYGFCLEIETDMERTTWDLRFEPELDEVSSALRCDVQPLLLRCAAMATSAQHVEKVPQTASSLISSLAGLDLHLARPSHDSQSSHDDHDSLSSYFVPLTSTLVSNLASDTLTAPEEELSQADALRPLFIDSEGHISLPLWRLAVLANFSPTPSDAGRHPDARMLQDVQQTLLRLSDDEGSTASCADTEGKAWDEEVVNVLRLALVSVRRLLNARIEKMPIAQNEAAALNLLVTQPQGTLLRSCVQHAYQEFAALRAADALMAELHSLVDETETG